MKAVMRWLDSQFLWKWMNKGGILPIGKQLDGNSCAICVLNAIAHALLKTPLWHQSRAMSERADWFVKLAKRHLDEVCNSPQ